MHFKKKDRISKVNVWAALPKGLLTHAKTSGVIR